VASYYSEKETQIVFDAIPANDYTLRIIYDDNRNKEWDSGNYLEKRQPEEVIYHPAVIELHENWDAEEDVNLSR
jgi:hypothetical protein